MWILFLCLYFSGTEQEYHWVVEKISHVSESALALKTTLVNISHHLQTKPLIDLVEKRINKLNNNENKH